MKHDIYQAKRRVFQAAMGLLACTQFVLAPLTPTQAGILSKKLENKFEQVCAAAMEKSKNPSAKVNVGPQHMAECSKAEMGLNVKKAETTKAVMFGVAAGVATAMAFTSWAGGDSVCMALSFGTSISSGIFDSKASGKNEEIVGNFSMAAGKAMNLAGGLSGLASLTGSNFLKFKANEGSKAAVKAGNKAFAKAQADASNNAFKQATGEGKSLFEASDAARDARNGVTSSAGDSAKSAAAQQQVANKTACIPTAVIMGIQAGVSTASAFKSKSYTEKQIEVARDIKEATTGPKYEFGDNGSGGTGGIGGDPSGGPARNLPVSYTCDQARGNAYLTCMSKFSPELQKLTSNPQFTGTLERALGGRNLGDFVKGYDGETEADLANYIAGGLGMPGSAMASLMQAQKKLAQDVGATGEAYRPSAFADSAGGGAGGGAGTDALEKMMADMMKGLQDPAMEEEAQRDLASVSNALDLMSPDKIAENKDISLFDRAHHRIQKNLHNLERYNVSERSGN